MTLASVQRGLHGLIRTGVSTSDDAYVRSVAGSDRVELLREIVLWWRTFGVRRSCPLTSRLLLREDRLDDVMAQFVANHSISPYIEDLAGAFLGSLTSDEDELVSAVASFEAALIDVKRGGRSRHAVEWPTEPYAVLAALLEDAPLPTSPGNPAWTIVSHELPHRFEVRAASEPN